jgi:peroxiredoxin
MRNFTYAKCKSYGLDLEETQGAKHHELPVSAVFIVDGKGKIRFAHTNADYTQRLPAADVVKAAQASIR